MKKKHIIFSLIVLGVILILIVLTSTGVISFDTFNSKQEIVYITQSVDTLINGRYYVWHNERTNDITQDLEGISENGIFQLCPEGDANWDDSTFVNHTLWFTSTNDANIPTLYPGDKLIYVSATEIPYQGIDWVRFADYGYTIGVANMVSDTSGHCYIPNSDGFDGYLYENSDAIQLSQYSSYSYIFLDKIGGTSVRDYTLSDGGTVQNLVKDKDYVCEWYTGTFYQDYKMKANIHTFGILESFTTYDYEFLHSNCIEITTPTWLKSGYYYLDGIGMFRYVSELDRYLYNGEPYDNNVDWNDPIIIYDDTGKLIYNPAEGVDLRNESSQETTSAAVSGNGVTNGNTASATKSNIGTTSVSSTADNSDAGAGAYEDIYNEVIVQ
jgi:hypothetical protein